MDSSSVLRLRLANRRWRRTGLTWRLALGMLLLAAAHGDRVASAAPDPLRWGVESGGHLSGNHWRPGPGKLGHPRFDGGRSAARRDRHPAGPDFVRQVGPRLKLHRDEFRFAGTNNYYLPYKSELMVDDVLARAADQGFSVVRTWGFIDIGNQDGTGSTHGKADGVVYFHFFDGTQPAFNDGPDGLQHLDYVIKRAGELGLRLVVALTNNWGDFGGMDQYVAWAGGQYHDQFYTDPKIRCWFKDWIAHVLQHQNSYTGIRYKDDPTIMTIELGNEPRCGGSGLYPRSPTCTTDTITSWAHEMSTFVKKIDRHHLVSVGDEGFYCDPSSTDWIDRCGDGVDTLALTALPNIDVMSFHLYPDSWLHDIAWGTEWINRHFADARALGKPAMLGEFGLLDKSKRNPTYKQWTDTTFSVGGAGALYWLLAGLQDDGTPYPDYDGFTVYCPSPVCQTFSNFAATMTANGPLPFAPVADADVAETVSTAPVSLTVLANDVTFEGAVLAVDTIDLDPLAPGTQAVLATAAGTFTANLDGTVTFAATAGFQGRAIASYVVSDSTGATSAPATLTVKVDPVPGSSLVLFSFEDGTDGWAPLNQPTAATIEQSTAYASAGSFSLKVTPTIDDWFGTSFASAIDLTGKTQVSWEVTTTSSGTSQELVLQTGANWDWCQAGTFEYVNPNQTKTVEIDLTTISCGASTVDLSQVHALRIYLGNGGTGPVYLDNIRAD